MNLFVLVQSIIFTMISCAVISYISMATMVGPWIAPAIILMSSVLMKLKRERMKKSEINKDIALIQTAGSVGGIIGMGIGFSLPTLYFLNPVIFNNWLQSPLYFCAVIAFVCIAAGGLGIYLARCFAQDFIKEEKLSFPVSQLLYEMISSQNQEKQAKNMFLGFGSSWIICFLRDGLLKFKGLLPKVFYIFPNFLGNEFAISISPMFWAIGFIAGGGIVFPLLVGMISKYLILYPLNHHSGFLPFQFFPVLDETTFIMAFSSGLVVSEFILGLLKYPKNIFLKRKEVFKFNFLNSLKNVKKFLKHQEEKEYENGLMRFYLKIEPFLVFSLSLICIFVFKFNIFSAAFLLITTIIFTRQISYFGAKLGLVPFGRFATFIMIPMLLIFKLDVIQITFLCVFFNVCAAVASDLLFDYKVGELCDISFRRVYKYQWLGLIITALCIGFFLWLLFTNFNLGSADLFAQRGKSRALLIQSLSFDWRIVLLGFLYGVVLKKVKISPTMVFGGILMPNSLTIGLVVGALSAWFCRKSQEQLPLWSGVFAGESMWILFSILLKMFC